MEVRVMSPVSYLSRMMLNMQLPWIKFKRKTKKPYNFSTTPWRQNLASIQPRTSLVKFARSPRTDPPGTSRLVTWKASWNPVKVSENRPACGTAQHTLAVCFVFEKLEKSRKFLVKIWRKFSKILAKFWQFLRKFRKNQQKFQQFLTKILRLKNGAKECIV